MALWWECPLEKGWLWPYKRKVFDEYDLWRVGTILAYVIFELDWKKIHTVKGWLKHCHILIEQKFMQGSNRERFPYVTAETFYIKMFESNLCWDAKPKAFKEAFQKTVLHSQYTVMSFENI